MCRAVKKKFNNLNNINTTGKGAAARYLLKRTSRYEIMGIIAIIPR